TGSPGQPPAPAPAASAAASASPSYSWYQSMMSGHYGNGTGAGTPMMGGFSFGSYGWMMSQAGYRWMTGASAASPGWMTAAMPSAMMGGAMMGSAGSDPGKIMGTLFASAPGPRISAAQATALSGQAPAGAQVSKAANTITFTTTTVRLAI